MNIYLITIPDNKNMYGSYESAVVIASDEENARAIHPSGKDWNGEDCENWACISEIDVELLGETTADTSYSSGDIICAFYWE